MFYSRVEILSHKGINLTRDYKNFHNGIKPMRAHLFSKIVVCVFSWALIAHVSCHAAVFTYPAACYTGDELAAVRVWEKTWADHKITPGNVEEIKRFLPESLYNLMKDDSHWGKSWFMIAPYRQILPTPGNIACTQKYHGLSKLDQSGEILNYVSGVPFPDTKNATEMVHNFRTRSPDDSYRSSEIGYIADGKLKYDMSLEIHNSLLFFSGRTDNPPVPELSDNKAQIWRAFSMLQIQPPETRNLRILEVHYKDRMKAYDSWIWNPTIRRVRRRSTSERQDAQGGADFCGFDNMGWDGPVSLNTYRYLGTQELLLARHNDAARLDHTRGECLWSGVQRERIKVHVIEAVNNDPNFLYSKMIWYLDPETWQILYSDRFDREGKLWKVLDQFGFVTKGYGETDVNYFSANQMIDVQRTHSTLATGKYEFGIDLPQSMFKIEYLQKYGY